MVRRHVASAFAFLVALVSSLSVFALPSGVRIAVTDDAHVLAAADMRVVLRPAAAAPRVKLQDGEHEMVIGRGMRFELDLATLDGIGSAVNDGRAVRFLATTPGVAPLTISAPEVRDAKGKPSHRVWWELAGNRNGRPSTLRLRIADDLLDYPLTVRYTATNERSLPRRAHNNSRLGAARTFSTHTGSIAGSLTDSFTGNRVPYELVHAYDANSNWIASGVSDATGNYTIADLPAGPYYVLAVPYAYDSKLYDGIECPERSCFISSGTPVTVTAGDTTRGIDFTLTSLHARITGTVTDSATTAILGGVGVVAFDAQGNRQGSGFADFTTGEYTILVPPGIDYYARTFNYFYSGYVDQLWEGRDCTGCNVATGTAISVAAGEVTPDIDFALDPDGGRISGRLTDDRTSAGIAYALVVIHAANGTGVTFAMTDAAGHYTSYNGLASGSYFVSAEPPGYDAEVWDNVRCGDFCDATTGTAVEVTKGETVADVDFVLHGNLTRVAGVVTDAGSGDPLEGVEVSLYDAAGAWVSSAFTDAEGVYQITQSSAGGTFYVRTHASNFLAGYLDEVYDDIPCLNCNVRRGTPIELQSGDARTGIDFAISASAGRIAGRVKDTAGAGIADAPVTIYDASGAQVSHALTDANGDYISFHGLVAGRYYVVTAPFGYSAELYNDISCPNGECFYTTGTGVNVSSGQTTSDIDFVLESSIARIRGSVVDAETNGAIEGIDVSAYTSLGEWAGSGTVRADGSYEIVVNDGGTYYVRTFDTSGRYADELYDDIVCNSCNVATGNPVQIAIGATVSGIDFALESISCPAIEVSPSNLPGGTVGDAYSETITASGGVAPYTLSLEEGTLPDGLTFNSSTGVLSGTLAASGSFGFFILAVDAEGCVGGRSYAIDVLDGAPVVTDIDPSSGPATGKQTVIISGSGLASVTSVRFDNSLAAIRATSATSIEVETPPHAMGTVNVSITTSGGSVTVPNAYTYTRPATSVLLSSSLNPSTYGEDVTFTAITGDGDVPGTITFYDGATAIGTSSVSLGEALLTTNALTAGSHAITARYSGDSVYDPSTSSVLTQVVKKRARTISFSVSPSSPRVYGTALTLTATISPTGDAATVQFLDGLTPIGTAAVSGNTATITISTLNAGSHTLSAAVGETTNHLPATSNSVPFTITKAARTIALTSAPNPSVYSNAVTITATLNSGVDSPVVEFFDGATSIGTATVTGNTATLTTTGLLSGPHTLSARTPETTNFFAAVSNNLAHQVNKAPRALALTVAPTPSIYGQAITLTATVAPSAEAATVEFRSGANVLGTGAISNGVATFTTSALGAGNYSFTAATVETANYLAGTSAAVAHTINKATPVFANLSAPTIIIATASTTISGTISTGPLVPTGHVTITIGATSYTAAIGANGAFSAVVATLALPVGTHAINFAYAGDANFHPATAASAMIVTYATAPSSAGIKNSPATILFEIQLLNANNQNVGAEAIDVTAYGVRLVGSSTWLPAQEGSGNTELKFQKNGGIYKFNLKTAGLAPGDYEFGFKATGDPVIHLVSFGIRP